MKLKLNVEKVILQADKQELGLILAIRACCGIVNQLLDAEGKRNLTPEEADAIIAKRCPNFRYEVWSTLADCVRKHSSDAYRRAVLWMSENFVQAWRKEAIEHYCERNNYKGK